MGDRKLLLHSIAPPVLHKGNAGVTNVMQKPCILVVEDDQETAEYLDRLLTEAGYAVILAGDATIAMALVQTHQPDLVLMDILLPGIDGYALTAELRGAKAQDGLPIIMLTALEQPAQRVRGFDAGADDYVVKPFGNLELLARIATHLRRHQATRALEQRALMLEKDLDHAQQQHLLSAQNAESERSMRAELLRSVNTHLQSLCTVFDNEYRREMPGPGRNALNRVIPRLRSAALIYQISEALTGDTTNLATLFETITASLKSLYSPRKRLPVSVTAPSLDIPSALASPLAMAITELVTNAFKHAFPGGRFGAITVIAEHDDEQLVVHVVDDGVGFDPATSGRGLAVARQMIHDIGGTLTLVSEAPGTRATVVLRNVTIGRSAPTIANA